MAGKEGEKTFMQKVCDNWNGFRHFMWNSEEKTVMGRGGKSWAKISFAYLIFYTCLAGFWAAFFAIFFQISIDPTRPKWTALVSTPGLNSVPQGNEDLRINWQPDNPDSYSAIIKDMQVVYDNLAKLGTEDCSELGTGTVDEPQRLCKFDVDTLGPNCVPPNFGWDSLKPCLYLTLNRVFGYIPINYDSLADVPDLAKAVYKPDNVAITCFQRKANDDSVNATMPFPKAGIPFGFFPFVGERDEVKRRMIVEPVVAVQISLKKANQVASILCQTFTGNIDPNGGLFDTDDESTLRIYLNPTRDVVDDEEEENN